MQSPGPVSGDTKVRRRRTEAGPESFRSSSRSAPISHGTLRVTQWLFLLPGDGRNVSSYILIECFCATGPNMPLITAIFDYLFTQLCSTQGSFHRESKLFLHPGIIGGVCGILLGREKCSASLANNFRSKLARTSLSKRAKNV